MLLHRARCEAIVDREWAQAPWTGSRRMPRRKQGKKSQKQNGGARDECAWLPPCCIRFAHSKICPNFSGCGTPVRDTLAQIQRGELRAEELPVITVLPLVKADDDLEQLYVSLNNRRLWVLKQCEEQGLLGDAGGGSGHVRVRARARAACWAKLGGCC